MTLQDVLNRLQGVRRSGDGWTARCPAHGDRNPSLSITKGGDGNILLHCHAGCSPEAVCDALGIKLSELFADGGEKPRIVAEYDYRDEQGALLFQVVRFEPKDFRQRRPDGRGGWTWNLHGVRRVLYGLPEVIAAKSLLVLEGERDCETARSLGMIATCNPGGAGRWREDYSETLRGKRVVVVADSDEPGRKHAQQVASSLYLRAESVRVLELPGAKDLADWVARGGTSEALRQLIDKTAEWHGDGKIRVFDLPDAEQFLKRDDPDEGNWQVKNLILSPSDTRWQGRPKVGKSHILLELAFDAASGLPVFGTFQTPRPLRVMYCELEEPEAVTKRRYLDMLLANGKVGPDPKNLIFFTKNDLHRFKLLSRELFTSALPTFVRTVQDCGIELLVIVALRKLLSGDRNDAEVAERFNDALDLLTEETKVSLAVVDHDRKAGADTVEAQGLGSTMFSAHADAIFDIRRYRNGLRQVRSESRYGAEERFLLRKLQKGDGVLIVAAQDPKAEAHTTFHQALDQGMSMREAAKTAGVPFSTAQRWANEE